MLRRNLVQLLGIAPAAMALPALASDTPPEPTKFGIWRSETEVMIAESAEDAADRFRRMIGWTPGSHPDSYESGIFPEHWYKSPDDKPFTLTEEVEGPDCLFENHWTRPYDPDELYIFDDAGSRYNVRFIDPIGAPPRKSEKEARVVWYVTKGEVHSKKTRKLPAEWVKELGPGYVCSLD